MQTRVVHSIGLRHAMRTSRALAVLALASLALACQDANSPAAREARRAKVEAAYERLVTGDVYERGRAAQELVELGPDALPALDRALDHPSTDVRESAVRALATMGGPGAVPLLGKALADDRSVVREPAAAALATYGAQALTAFDAALRSPNHYVREDAVDALGGYGPEALPLLRTALGDHDVRVRRRAVEALGRIGPDAMPLLREVEEGEDPVLRSEAERVLDRMRGDPQDARA